ncbi:MAG: transmembrane 220 family protein [Kofleriaceae bacterium]
MRSTGKLAASATAVFALACAASAALQYNDPDPWRWVATYLGAGAAAVVALMTPRRWWMPVVAAAVTAAWAGWLWAHVAGVVQVTDLWRKMSEKGGRVEEMREAGGLTLAALGCALAARRARRIATDAAGQPRRKDRPTAA